MALTERLEWVLEDPRRIFDRLPFGNTAPLSPLLLLVSAILSFAVADAWMAPATARELPWTILLYLADAGVLIFLYYRLSRLWKVPNVAFRAWWRAGAISAIPLHLVLPAALLLNPFGTAGFVAYEFFKLFILAWMLRRWVWAVELLNAWPAWAAALLVAGPFILGVGIALACVVVGLGAAAIAVLGILK